MLRIYVVFVLSEEHVVVFHEFWRVFDEKNEQSFELVHFMEPKKVWTDHEHVLTVRRLPWPLESVEPAESICS